VVEKIGADIVEPFERPVKKLTKEVVETVTGTEKPEVTPVVTPEVTPEVVEDEKPPILTRYATRGKRSGQAGTIMEGYGVIQRKKSGRAVT